MADTVWKRGRISLVSGWKTILCDTKNGSIVTLAVRGYVPYLLCGDPLCQPFESFDTRPTASALPAEAQQVDVEADNGDDTSSTSSPASLDDPAEGVPPPPVDDRAPAPVPEAAEAAEPGELDRSGPPVLEPPPDVLGRFADPPLISDMVPPPPEPWQGELRRDRMEAKSVRHLMTHKPKNPNCPECMEAKIKNKRRLRGAFARELKKWGDVVTCDFMNLQKSSNQAFTLEREAFTIVDLFTRLKDLHATRSRMANTFVTY